MCAEEPIAGRGDHRAIAHVPEVPVELDDVVDGRAGGGQDAVDVLEHLLRLLARVTLADERAGLVDRDLPRDVDEAIRRRFHLVPFTVTIAKPDKNLPDKLRKEWPGILQWAIDGCLAWQSEGLNPPKVVREATDDYLGDEEALARWIDDCCVVVPGKWCASNALWNSWKPWAEAHNERVGSQKSLGSALDAHGYARGKEKDVRGYQGIGLKPGIDLNDAREQPPENG